MPQEFNKANIDQLMNMIAFLGKGGEKGTFNPITSIDPTNFPKVDTSALAGLLSPDTGTLPLTPGNVNTMVSGGQNDQLRQLYNLINAQLYSIGR